MVLPSTGQVIISGEITFQLNTDPATDPPVFTLTCTSTGDPATTVSWSRDGTMLSDDSNHDITSQVTDTVTATYTNTLTVTGRLAGQYECNVSNSRTPSGSTRSLTVVGKGLHMIVKRHAYVIRLFSYLQWLTFPPTSMLYRLVPAVSESPGPHQALWQGIRCTGVELEDLIVAIWVLEPGILLLPSLVAPLISLTLSP